jgi:hypothetical protein
MLRFCKVGRDLISRYHEEKKAYWGGTNRIPIGLLMTQEEHALTDRRVLAHSRAEAFRKWRQAVIAK